MKINRSMDASMSSYADYPIATDGDIKDGQVVKLAAGKVVVADVAETAAILGLAEENHTGVTDAFNARNDGPLIRVSDSPASIYEAPASEITASGGSSTTMVATTLAVFADDDFNGGFLELIAKTDTSANTDSLGTLYEITDFVAATKTFTVDAAGTHTSGDEYRIYPPNGFQKGNLSADLSKVVLTANAAIPFRVYGRDTLNGLCLYTAALHLNANKQS